MRRMLSIGKGERIFAACGVGYPSRKFRNKVQGRSLDIRWNP